ncbi:hypothetical protein KJ966_19835 [bacterium]|nr:hypothetical protein [bacterium]
MPLNTDKAEREKKLRALELKIRMRRFLKLKDELVKVKEYLLADIELMEKMGDHLPEELLKIKKDLQAHK